MTRQEYRDKLWFLRLVSSTWLQTRGVIHVRWSKNYTERLVKYAQLAFSLVNLPKNVPHLHLAQKSDFYVRGRSNWNANTSCSRKDRQPNPAKPPETGLAPCHPPGQDMPQLHCSLRSLPGSLKNCEVSISIMRLSEKHSDHVVTETFTVHN